MKERQFYYLKGRDQFGPYSLEELKQIDLNPDTYVWTETMDNWEKIKNIPELSKDNSKNKLPPPPPNIGNSNDEAIMLDGKGNANANNSKKLTISGNPSIKRLTIIIIWSAFHLFALLMSYSGIEVFNNFGRYNTDKFWPFVSFWTKARRTYPHPDYFDGIFTQYDWSEFAFYIGIGIVIYVLIVLSKKK